MSDSKLLNAILELGKSGCQGNTKDYECWLSFQDGVKYSASVIQEILEELKNKGEFQTHQDFPGEYMLSSVPPFPDSVDYSVSGNLADSPLQLVRSRLEAFLKYHGISEEEIIDLTIGTTEAMENAVKYSDHKGIDVHYRMNGDVFEIKIVNSIEEVIPEQDIEAGKYSSSVTLMRGMMVMVKLFDEMDIDIKEELGKAIFIASRKLRR